MAAPTLNSATLGTNGTTLTLAFTVTTSPLIPASGVTGFTVKVNGVTVSQSSAVVSGNTNVVITLATAVGKNYPVTVAYTAGNLTDTGSVALANFTAQAVTNGSTQMDYVQAFAEAIGTYTNSVFINAGISSLTLNSAVAYFTDGHSVTSLVPVTIAHSYTTTFPEGYRVNNYDAANKLVSSLWFTKN